MNGFYFAYILTSLAWLLSSCRGDGDLETPLHDQLSSEASYQSTATPPYLKCPTLGRNADVGPCPGNPYYLCSTGEKQAICWLTKNHDPLPYCTSNEGKGYGAPQPCPKRSSGICSWDDSNYKKACTPVTSPSGDLYCSTNYGEGFEIRDCTPQPGIDCRSWQDNERRDCIPTRASNGIPFCSRNNGLGQGNPFPCNLGKGLICAIRLPDLALDWCVQKKK